MNFPNLRQMAKDGKFYGFESSREELVDALNIIDVFEKLNHLAQGLVCKPSSRYFVAIGDDGFSIRFEISPSQAASIERLEKDTRVKEVPT